MVEKLKATVMSYGERIETLESKLAEYEDKVLNAGAEEEEEWGVSSPNHDLDLDSLDLVGLIGAPRLLKF